MGQLHKVLKVQVLQEVGSPRPRHHGPELEVDTEEGREVQVSELVHGQVSAGGPVVSAAIIVVEPLVVAVDFVSAVIVVPGHGVLGTAGSCGT